MAVYPAGAYASANIESLYRANEAGLQGGDIAMTFIAWVYVTSLDATVSRAVIGKWDYVHSQREYLLRTSVTATNRFQFFVNPTGSAASTSVNADTFGNIPLETWCFLAAYHDPDTNLIGISVNGGAWDTASHSTGVYAGTSPYIVGGFNYIGAADFAPMNGRIAPVGYANGYILSAADIAELYNSGNGRLWAQLSSGLKAKFGSCWWDMTETSGDRASWDGNMNLTDSNTVTYADGPIVVPEAGWRRRDPGIWTPGRR